MALFAMKFERAVTIYETCHRIIEAPTMDAAQAVADRLASSFNHDCPDDAEEVQGAGEYGDWSGEASDDVEEGATPDFDADGNEVEG